jgi:hypothetical protein
MKKILPQDIVSKRPSRIEGWIPTFSGVGFHPITPKESEVRIEDIARGLAFKYRYGGQTEPITVAEHSILVSRIIEILWPESRQMLAGLLHDACEGYTHDIQAPVRKSIRVQIPNGTLITWGDMERAINQVIAKALGIGQDFYQAPEVRAADILALALEKEQIPALRQFESWGTPAVPAGLAKLKVEFLSPEMARDAFLGRYYTLKGVLTPLVE